VAGVRWLGSIGVVELAGGGYHDVTRSQRIRQACLERGLLVRPLGPVVYTLPPLATPLSDLRSAWETIAATLTV
jgi:adenosylmethionine-8-amino-7-oxononanoate aminotransferase